MTKKVNLLLLLLFTGTFAWSQTGTIKGAIKDQTTGEPLIGATVLIGQGVGTVTDFDGKFTIVADYGDYDLSISYVGFEGISQPISLDRKLLVIKEVKLATSTLTEVQVIADVARERETPVAFANVLPAQIEEELASQDIPMVMNSTPGVYATQQGGGDGDARITIRGFNQRNVAVMIDGIPVNDMENGWVYWSNWFGLDMVTRSIQIQRGLGASKIAIPSVGGTMNILTKGIEQKKSISVKQEVGNNGFSRTSIGLTSGKLENGWGFSAAGSYKRGNGWVDQAFTDGWFYYLKIEKSLGNHILGISAMGAPQSHGQRSYKSSIGRFSTKMGETLGISDTNYLSNDISSYDSTGTTKNAILPNRGLQYNKHWGTLNRYTIENGDTTFAEDETINERVNYYHKPQFSLRDFWTVNDKLYISNVAYLSIGNGGGTRLQENPNEPGIAYLQNDYTGSGQINFQKIYDANAYGQFSIDQAYSPTEHKASNILRSSVNNHFWYGLLSTANYRMNNNISLSGGFDLRSYNGEHYGEVYDLLGGDYYVSSDDNTTADFNNPTSIMKKKGDKIGYHDKGIVRWAGSFFQMEYKNEKWSTFLNLSGAYTGYKRIDYFKKKDLVLTDTTFSQTLGINDTLTYNGTEYTINSKEAKYSETAWKWMPGYTIKGGANYNIDKVNNVFFNIGYLSKAPSFINVIDYGNSFIQNIENEIIKAIELGYSFRIKRLAININMYHTQWENKPVSRGMSYQDADGNTFKININGMDALHKGAELDFAYNVLPNFTFEGLASIGNWTWESAESVVPFNENTQQYSLDTVSFDAKGIHVGDAAQTQYAASLRYEIIKGLYVKSRGTYFARHYADFNPFSLSGEFAQKDSWIMPSYLLIDIHSGYKIKLEKMRIDFRFSILNALNTEYISDARNNDSYSTNSINFDAQSAGVFFGMGRRFNISVKLSI